MITLAVMIFFLGLYFIALVCVILIRLLTFVTCGYMSINRRDEEKINKMWAKVRGENGIAELSNSLTYDMYIMRMDENGQWVKTEWGCDEGYEEALRVVMSDLRKKNRSERYIIQKVD